MNVTFIYQKWFVLAMKSIFEEAICQLCLQVDVKLFKISDVQHVFIESILKLNDIHYVPSENLSVCPICMALLVKTFNFVQTVWKAQEIVYDFLQSVNMITKSSLRLLDRHKIGLNPVKLKSKAITITKVVYDVCNSENIDINNTLDVDPEEHHSISRNTNKSLLSVVISGNKEGVVEQNEGEELVAICPVDRSDTTSSPLIPVINSNSHTFDLRATECASLKECNEAPVDITSEDSSNITKESALPVIKPNTISIDLGESLNECNGASISKNHEDDGDDTKYSFSPIKSNLEVVSTIKCESLIENCEESAGINQGDDSNDSLIPVELKLVTIDLAVEEYDSLIESNKAATGVSHEDDGNDTNDPLLSVIKSNPVSLDIDNYPNTTQIRFQKKTKATIKKKKKKIDIEFEPESPSEDEKKQLEKDGNYMPSEDSTSHSEDSAYDDFDDNGKKIAKPRHGLAYPRQCDNCNYEVPRHYEHFRHYIFMHPNIPYPYGEKKEYACSVCGKMTIHTGTKPFKCHICDAAFAHSGNRIVHIRSAHQNIKYVPKKKVKKDQKAKSKNKHSTYDSNESSDEGTLVKRRKRSKPTSKSRKRKNNVESKKKLKPIKKMSVAAKENIQNKDTNSESEDELLSDIKLRKTFNE
ncbi:zinc finger E-box-binding homeobox 1-like isoform X3 [Helicoverpa zea]|uniref:zinc finger E-box-binding homeobox 1-like isoform X3 n=1 Tax=Helicoverpa zea TaxID=7113 RepID=UPI001F56A0F3|nr:zinc finger E-box-binding homeobox 1-like isoform X3 [Helicoverpa zea]